MRLVPISLVPRPPPFSFFGLHSVYMEAEECEKLGRPGNTYHVNDIRWMRSGRREGSAVKYMK